mgnify:CR=1 FL=1
MHIKQWVIGRARRHFNDRESLVNAVKAQFHAQPVNFDRPSSTQRRERVVSVAGFEPPTPCFNVRCPTN